MPRPLATMLAVSLALFSLPALAAPSGAASNGASRLVNHGARQKKFPMSAADFRQQTTQRIDKARERLEANISKKQLPAAKAKDLRNKFEAKIAEINQAVEKVTADGTVTKEEAKEINELFRKLFAKHHDAK